MLKQHAAFWVLIRIVTDTAIVFLCWVGAYYLRFYSGMIPVRSIPAFGYHLQLTAAVLIISTLSFSFTGLYSSKRVLNTFKQAVCILKAVALAALVLLAFLYYIRQSPYSRTLLALFVPMLVLGLSMSHSLALALIRLARKRGYNLRHFAVIGTNKAARELVSQMHNMAWLGLRCDFFVDDAVKKDRKIMDIPVYGPIDNLPELARQHQLDEVYLAATGAEALKAYPILAMLQARGVTVRIVPDWGHLLSTGGPVVVQVGSQILFSAADSPLNAANIVIKEIFDRLGALILLTICALPMVIIALLIKLTSPGPVFYRQLRLGVDQRKFNIIKFRTMKVDAEKTTGPKWCTLHDNRCTAVGKWLRKTSLDELPQLLNVLAGHMSLVGPRPERPCFVKQFCETHRKYMLRHKVKSGMTGYAQVNGLRGNTSLKKRLVYDLYYVRNWSLMLDFWILLKTPISVIAAKGAH